MVDNNTYLGFDFGTKRIGVAVGQSITKTATPLAPLVVIHHIVPWREIHDLVQKWRPTALIVGIPLNMDGSKQPITLAALNFAEMLYEKTHIPIYSIDERLTTKEAKEQIFSRGGYKALKKESIDSLAASLILTSWLHNPKDAHDLVK
jgi:putative holliday junction resolvase